ncbi:DNA circularization protein [Pseudomonas akapageensis]|uniref:DNA circularization protein n=1 Tax=Pseudomonas akapageensis TaxID=2609961 RepID=UPI00140C0148|nr:DNA circularization N-terminal domain-containing protein [Pseudomonas akapageensis]
MTTTWRDSLLPASFRGVSFVVDQAGVPVGRKGQLHEYPQRDDPYFEALGKQSQVHKLTAYVIGPDCFARRDKLLEALEAEGPGELVHPWLGRMQVQAGECELQHDRREGGMARFDLTFYPDRPRKFPTATVNSQQQVSKSSQGLLSSALGRYSTAMAKVDQARINLNSLRGSVSGVFGVIQRQFAPLAGIFGGANGLAQSLVNSPSSLNSLFYSYFGGTGSSSSRSFSSSSSSSSSTSTGTRAGEAPDYRAAVATSTQHAEDVASINTVSQSSGMDTGSAAQAAANLVQDALLVQVAGVVAQMPVATQPESVASTPSLAQQVVQPVERPEVPVADEVLTLRDTLNDAIWEASLKADPQHFQALATLRQALAQHLTVVAASGVRLVEISPAETLPALVLAYCRFGDATRAGEVVQRNRVRHPGFVPPVALKVAQE